MHLRLRAITADLEPRMGANELLPIWTRRPVIGRYKMNALLSGIMWSVAPDSAMRRRLLLGRSLLDMNAVERADGLLSSAMTSLGSWTMRTLLGSKEDVDW
jgi:hypothetical protein